jgi:hypothetical protein
VKHILTLGLLCCLATGCIFLTRFDTEDQACEPTTLACSAGYTCVSGKCKRGGTDAGITLDAGTTEQDASVDAGKRDGG